MDGISFVMRVRNEEDTLETAIRSLFSLTINYEIIIILHLCTDKSSEIAHNLQSENNNIKIYEYSIEISKAGYETLVTDKYSQHSLVVFYDWCFQKASYPWKFKMDADFLLSEKLISFINNNTWEERNEMYIITCEVDNFKNKEPYLMGNLLNYGKYYFWEVPCFKNNNFKKIILDNDLKIIHNSKLSLLKNIGYRKSGMK